MKFLLKYSFFWSSDNIFLYVNANLPISSFCLTLYGIKINEPHYKRLPQGFDEQSPYAYLSKYNALYTQMSYRPNKTFFSEKAIDKHFVFYEASLELFEWLYELTLYNPKD